MNQVKENYWTNIIVPKRHLLEINLSEIIEYKDLLFMFIRRDIVTIYKQTILGPIWYFIQPLLTMVIYIVIFSNIAKIPTDGIPPSMFYLTGIIIWNYFTECFTQTSDSFFINSSLFGKVYFPRLIIPLSKLISSLIKLFFQSSLLLIVYIYFILNEADIHVNNSILLIPFFILLIGGIGLGLGLIISSLTTKYRDLTFVTSFGIQLLMYATPIIYPMSILPEQYRQIMNWNPIAHIVEGCRYAILGAGQFTYDGIFYTTIFTIIVLFTGIIMFNSTERNFMDTV